MRDSREDRLNDLRSIARRLGTFDFHILIDHLDVPSRFLGEPGKFDAFLEAFRKRVYRDLEFLVSRNDLKVEYFSHAGELLELDGDANKILDGKIQKSFVNKWTWIGSKTGVRGGDCLLEKIGRVVATRAVQDALRLDYLLTEPNVETHSHLIFCVEKTFYKLSISKDELPVKILIGRSSSKDTSGKLNLIDMYGSTIGARGCCIELNNIETMSAFRDRERKGQFLVHIESDMKTVSVQNLGPKNSSMGREISTQESMHIHSLIRGAGDQTMTSPRSEKVRKKLASSLAPISSTGFTKMKSPAYLETKDFFSVFL